MAHYQNGQQYFQQHQTPHGQDPYNPRRPPSFEGGDDQAYGPNGDQTQNVEYGPGLRARTNSNSARMNAELFMDANNPSAPPQRPTGPPNASFSPHSPPSAQFTYNPQDYAQPMQSPTMPSYPSSMPRRPSFPTPPAPYNPADYAEGSLQRVGSTAGYGHGFSPGYPNQTVNLTAGVQAPLPSPGLYQTVSTSRPHPPYATRPTVQTSPYSSHTAPSRSSHYTPPAPPPLPAIPGSAESPSDDWGQIPTRYTSTHRRYGDTTTVAQSQPIYSSSPAVRPTRDSRSSSAGQEQSPYSNSLPATPGPPPPPHSSTYAAVIDQHPHSRPLPRLPSDPYPNTSDYFSPSATTSRPGNLSSEQMTQENLENEILGLTTQSPGIASSNGMNGGFSDEDTDPEALAGLEAMREAERQDAEDEARRRSGTLTGVYRTSTFFQPQATPPAQHTVSDVPSGSDSDVPFDLGSYGGGFEAHMSYGGDPNQLRIQRNESLSESQSRSQPVSSSGSMRRSGHVSDTESNDYDFRQSFSYSHARVDAFGTGGLADPGARDRRLSYDEGDEAPLLDYSSLAPGEPPPEIFYNQQSSLTGRPLPPPPPDAYGAGAPYPADYGSSHHIQFPPVPTYAQTYYQQQPPTGSNLPRHTSLVSHPSTPQAIAPARAITDAEQRRRQQQRISGTLISDSSSNGTANASAVALDLPSITKKFNPAKLNPRDFDRCREPWALSALVAWLQIMVEGEQFLKKHQLVEALVALFTYKVPTMNIADAETLSDRLVDELLYSGVLYEEEEWLFFSQVPTSGVIYQLTGIGCYAPKLHETKASGRCYSYHCQRTEKKVDLSDQSVLTPDEDWASYYKLKKDDVEGKDKKEIERQNILHEIVQKEENYLRELHTLITLYRDQLQNANPPLIPPKKLQAFIWDVFGKAAAVKKANEEHLLPQLKYRQKEQGPWVVGFSDIFREWIRKAKSAYLEYASQFPGSSYKIRQEMERNMLFRTFLDKCQADPQSRRLGWDHYLKVPITRLQQVGFLLENALKKSKQDSDEKRNLIIAIDEIKAVTHECDMKVGEGQRRVEMQDLAFKLKLRPGMQRVELNLDHLGREVLYQGDLLRIGGSRFTWLETHAVLLDNYLVLAKSVTEKTPDGRNAFERYDVSRLPIPMDLLILESRDDDAVVRAALAGRAGVQKVAPNPAQEQLRLARTNTNQSPIPGNLPSNNTSTSLNSLGRVSSLQSTPPIVTPLEGPPKDDKTLYPFRVKHLGKETYTLYAPTLQNREEWCNKVIEARTKHAAALFAQNAEPFKLRVIADSAFAYDGAVAAGQSSIVIKGTPLDRAIRDVEKMYANTGRPGPVCRAKVNCATSFIQPGGKQMVAVGTEFGVYISETDNPRGWQRVITNPRVTQIAVLEDFSLFLLISDKALIAYHLDVVCPPNGVAPPSDNVRRAPQKLSGSRDVGFFATGRMKDRCLVFYKKRDGISSTFKVITVLEPVFQKASEKKSRFPPLRSGKTEFFRDFDEFYIPTECMGINIFHSSLAISTQRGFEILTLDKKQPISIPDLEASHVQMIAQRLQGQKPLGMFRLSESEFLLCYEECAVYVNKHGDISRSVIMEFVGRARAAAMVGSFVLLFDADFVEVRNAQNGRLRQVVAGRDVKCLDDGLVGGMSASASGERKVKLCMQHPEIERVQVVVELVLNEGLKEQ